MTRVSGRPVEQIQHTETGNDYVIFGTANLENSGTFIVLGDENHWDNSRMVLYARDSWRSRLAARLVRWIFGLLMNGQAFYVRARGEFNQAVKVTRGGVHIPRFVSRHVSRETGENDA